MTLRICVRAIHMQLSNCHVTMVSLIKVLKCEVTFALCDTLKFYFNVVSA